jgi:hypothetical protein
MFSTIVRRTTVGALLVTAGCVTGHSLLGGSSGHDWDDTLTQAEAAASDHRFADADRLLADFAARYPGTQGAIESSYWRGVIALEPANQDGSPQIAAALFETYNRAGGKLPHQLEAGILHDIALRLQAAGPSTVAVSAPANNSAAPGASGAADLKAKDTEIQRLKDELAKANDELERIKRRLTAPTKP